MQCLSLTADGKNVNWGSSKFGLWTLIMELLGNLDKMPGGAAKGDPSKFYADIDASPSGGGGTCVHILRAYSLISMLSIYGIQLRLVDCIN